MSDEIIEIDEDGRVHTVDEANPKIRITELDLQLQECRAKLAAANALYQSNIGALMNRVADLEAKAAENEKVFLEASANFGDERMELETVVKAMEDVLRKIAQGEGGPEYLAADRILYDPRVAKVIKRLR